MNNTNLIIQVKIKNVYGNELIYPACKASEAFARIAKKKTLDTYDLNNIRELGFEVKVINAYGL